MSLADVPLVIVMLFITGISVIVAHMVLTEYYNAAAAVPEINETLIETGINALEIFNAGFVVIFVCFYIVLGVMGYFLRTHPIFIIPSIVVLLLTVYISVPIANTFLDIADQPAFTSTVTEYGIIINIFQNFPLFNLIMGAVVIILTYAIPRSNEDVYASG